MTQAKKLQKMIEFVKDKGFHFQSNESQEALYWQDLWDNKDKIIFSHSFLKAFFGEEYIQDRHLQSCIKNGKVEPQELVTLHILWQYHAQQLATTPEEKRIDYLYEFIKDK